MPVDLVFCGKQTIDGDTAQVGPGIAKRLNLELLTYISSIVSVNTEKKEIVVQRRSEGGVQVLKTRLPSLVTMLEGSNEMRFATMPNMIRAARTTIKTLGSRRGGYRGRDQDRPQGFAHGGEQSVRAQPEDGEGGDRPDQQQRGAGDGRYAADDACSPDIRMCAKSSKRVRFN